MTHPDPKPQASLAYTKMMFLVSHGLQTPLSAIRWGLGRLKRSAVNLSEEDRKILENVQHEARTLSEMFERLLLLAKVEEKVHVPNIQELYLHDYLTALDRTVHLPREVELRVTCEKELMLRTDRTIFSAVLDGLLLVAAVSSREKILPVTVLHKADEDMCTITVEATLELSLLQEELPEETKQPRIVGGVSGFLLAVSSTLANAISGTLNADDEDGLVQRLVLRVPVTPTLQV